ncbi:hypothetical protein V6Z11_D05G173800 [Gossypium hirsutum]
MISQLRLQWSERRLGEGARVKIWFVRRDRLQRWWFLETLGFLQLFWATKFGPLLYFNLGHVL